MLDTEIKVFLKIGPFFRTVQKMQSRRGSAKENAAHAKFYVCAVSRFTLRKVPIWKRFANQENKSIARCAYVFVQVYIIPSQSATWLIFRKILGYIRDFSDSQCSIAKVLLWGCSTLRCSNVTGTEYPQPSRRYPRPAPPSRNLQHNAKPSCRLQRESTNWLSSQTPWNGRHPLWCQLLLSNNSCTQISHQSSQPVHTILPKKHTERQIGHFLCRHDPPKQPTCARCLVVD